MKSRMLEAWGFGTALFISEIYPVLNINGLSAYHFSSVNRTTLLLALLGIATFAGLYLAIFWWMPQSPGWRKLRFSLIAVLPMLPILANRYAIALAVSRKSADLRHMVEPVFVDPLRMRYIWIVFLTWLAVLAVAARWKPTAYGAFVAVGRIALIAIGILGCFATLDIFRALYAHRHDRQFLAMHQRNAEQEQAHPRIVWIIFDELSYAQALGNRQQDLQLPNVDGLVAQSDVYTNARPVAFATDLAIPSMLAGKQLIGLRYSFQNGARFRQFGSENYEPLNLPTTLIGEAQAHGWNVGMVGWWNPYCSLFAGYLQDCHWYTDAPYGKMRSFYSSRENFDRWFQAWYSVPPGKRLLRSRIQEDARIYAWGQDLIQNEKMDFVFVHIAAPHPPYVYDRHTGQKRIEPGGSYLDGLALVDNVLGGIMQSVQASPRWKNTTVVVQGDHSWRTPIYRGVEWSPEDERISNGGKFDDRPFLVIHNVGQTTRQDKNAAVSLLQAHDVMESIVEAR
jgi:hypothetical protein